MLRFFVCALVTLASQVHAQTRVDLSGNASIMYYNTPAALHSGEKIFAGWIANSGSVEIAAVRNSKIAALATVHKYGAPDDHAAPALALLGGRLVVATAHHSSDLFVYSANLETLDARLHCRVAGRISYPRFIDSKAGLLLLIRTEESERGDLSVVRISETGCSEPERILTAPDKHWIYAAPPALNDGELIVAWSLYDPRSNRHEGVFLSRFDEVDLRHSSTTTIRNRSSDGPELLAWSVDQSTVTYVRFSGRMECCEKGSQALTTVHYTGKTIVDHKATYMPLYPSQAVTTDCSTKRAIPLMSQTIGNTAVISSEVYSHDHRSKDFRSSVYLCVK